MDAQIAEAESKVQAAEADRLQAEAQLAAAQSTYERTQEAAKTPGAIAGNDLIQAQKQVEAAQALVNSRQQASRAAQSAVQCPESDAGVSEDHCAFRRRGDGPPGASRRAGGPGPDPALLVIQQVSHLRVVVPVPGGRCRRHRARREASNSPFPRIRTALTPARSRASRDALDQKTRTMPVELDVFNRDGSLAPGMYPERQMAGA